VRLFVILLLSQKDMSVGELAKATGETQSNISHHLAMLNKCRIINAKKAGKKRIYALNKEVVPLLRVAKRYTEKCKKGCKNAKSCLLG